MMTMRRVVFALAAASTFASASTDAAQLVDLPSVMIISKSSNRNEVHYAALVDSACAPASTAPVHAYWLMRERGPNVTEPLQSSELRVLGVERQEVAGSAVRFSVRGMPSRRFTLHTERGAAGTCTSWVETEIAGAPARLTAVYVQQRLFGVDYVQLTGRTPGDKVVNERVVP
jgi:hypothetical protein